MKKSIIFALYIISLLIFTGCRSSQTDYEKIIQRLYSHYGWIYPNEAGLVAAFFRGTYIDENGKLIIRIGVEKDDELFDKLVQEMKEVAWPSGKSMPEVDFISANVTRNEALKSLEELKELWRANKDSIWKDVQKVEPNRTGVVVYITDLTQEKAAAIRTNISNPGYIDFFDPLIPERSLYVSDKRQEIVTRNSDYKKIIMNLEKYYGKIPEQFPAFRIDGFKEIEYQGCYIDSEGILNIIVGGDREKYDENVNRILKIAWPDTNKDIPEVIIGNDWLVREEFLELQDEIWEQIRENYFDKKSIWSEITAVYQESTQMGLEVRNLTEKKKTWFRSQVSSPNALFFRETRTDLPSKVILVNP